MYNIYYTTKILKKYLIGGDYLKEKEIINLRELSNLIIKRKIMLVTIVLISVFISVVVSYFIIKPIYQSDATVIVDKSGNDTSNTIQYNDVMMYENLVTTYAYIGKSDLVYTDSAKQLNNRISPLEISQSITITPVTNTQLLTISAKGNSAKDASEIVNAVTNSFIKVANQLYPAGDIRIVNNGKVPQTPVSPNKKYSIAIGFLVGLLLSLGIIFTLESYNNKMETEEDIKKYFDFPVLGVIEMRK